MERRYFIHLNFLPAYGSDGTFGYIGLQKHHTVDNNIYRL